MTQNELSIIFDKLEVRQTGYNITEFSKTDPSAYDRYHCSHSAGVHTIALPWAQNLNTFVTDDEESNLILPDNQQCIVEHVISTKPLVSSADSPILGLSVVTDPSLGTTLLVLTNDYRFAALPLGSKHRTASVPLASDSLGTTVTSPLRKICRQPFDKHIAQLLKRTSSNPLLQSGSGTDVSQQQCFQLLCRATQVLREEYIQKQDQARIEIETRVRILKEQKINQVEDIQRLHESRNILQDKADGLADKLELCHHSQELILKRLDAVLRKVQSRLPMLSNAEKSFSKELQSIGDNVKMFSKNLEQLKKKQEYQKRRMDPGSNTFTNSPILKGNQMKHLKDILKEESDEISNLIKQVNEIKINTNISSS